MRSVMEGKHIPKKGTRISKIGGCRVHGEIFHYENGEDSGVCQLAPLREGQPIAEDETVVMAKDGVITDVFTVPSRGPAKANSAAYRSGYERVFGDKKAN
jgi:hypothetical protein